MVRKLFSYVIHILCADSLFYHGVLYTWRGQCSGIFTLRGQILFLDTKYKRCGVLQFMHNILMKRSV